MGCRDSRGGNASRVSFIRFRYRYLLFLTDEKQRISFTSNPIRGCAFAFIDTRSVRALIRMHGLARLMQSYVTGGRGFIRRVSSLDVCQCEIFVPFVSATSDSLSTVEEQEKKGRATRVVVALRSVHASKHRPA